MNDNDKRWKDHAIFLGELADRVTWLAIAQGADRTEAVNEYTRWLSEKCFRHAEGHCREDFENGVLEPGRVEPGRVERVFEPGRVEPGKVVGASHWPDVSENQVVEDVSVSGDRVKRDEDENEVDWDTYKKRWNKAKWAPHGYADNPVVAGNDDDDSVITSQEECAKRFADGDAVRRNYAGIND